MDEAEKAAFEAAFERHNDELFRHARLRLSNRERAVELTQECFLKAWEYVCRGEAVRQYRPFLYRILNNLIIDEYRRAKPVSLDALLENEETREAMEGELLSDEGAAMERTLAAFDGEVMIGMLSKLPQAYRDVLVLRYVDGLAIGEIAEMLREAPGAISVRIHRALRKLRESLPSEASAQHSKRKKENHE